MRVAVRLSAVLLAGVLSGAATVAHAQMATQDTQVAGWIFTPIIRVGGAWDDNVLVADPTGNPPGDYATPVSPSASLDYRGRRTHLSTGYDGSFLLYRSFSELNSSDHRVRGLVEYRSTPRLLLFADGDFARVPTTDALIVAGIPFYRVGSQMSGVGGGMEATLAPRVSLRGEYTLRHVDFEEDFGDTLQGGYAHEGIVSLTRAVSARLRIGGEYDGRHGVLAGGLDHFDSHGGRMTVEYELTPTVNVFGLAGVSWLGAGLNHDAKIGPVVRAGITRRARLLILSAVYGRSFIPAFGFGGTFQNQEWQGTAQVPFARNRGYVAGGVAWFVNEPLDEQQPDVQSRWLNATLGYRATRWLSFEGYYAQSHQDNQQRGGDLGRQQIGFRIIATKPMKLR